MISIRNIKQLFLCLLLAVAPSMNAQQWTDVTHVFITNPDFSDGRNAWSLEGSGGSFGVVNYGCMEVWQGVFTLTQQLQGLIPGHYRLSVQAYYRTGDFSQNAYQAHTDGTEEISARLFCRNGDIEKTLPIVSVYSDYQGRQNKGGWWSPDKKVYFPNNMEAAAICFGDNRYWNSLEFDTPGGEMSVGIENWGYINSNWCIWDNFKLEFQGQVVKAQTVSVTAEKTQLLIGENVQLTANVLPANTLQKKVSWTSSNSQVATVDQNGLVSGLSAGNVTVTATTTDGSDKSGSVQLTVNRNEATAASLIINEIMASNVDEFMSPAFNFDGWIELYNPTDKAVELAQLTVANEQGEQWTMPTQVGVLPAKGYKVIWFDSNDIAPQNAPFKLDTDGGTITISNSSGQTIASQTYPASLERVSYARTTDGGDTWGLTHTPTPQASNTGSTFATAQLSAPVVDQPSQLFTEQLSVNVTVPSGCKLRYTTDGTLPTLTNGHDGPGQFRVTQTTVYRFRLYADDMLASPVTTRSYIYKDRDYYLPTISVVADRDFLWSSDYGVFAKGPNGRPGNGQDENCNFNMNWERPVNFSYLNADGRMVFNQDVNLEVCGGWSRAWDPRAFKLKGNKELGGSKQLHYPFFTQKPYIRNRTLQIRNGGNDNNCRFKDPALGYIVWDSGIDIDVQSYQPIHEFINGQYMGVLNMREPNNKHYVYANYGWSDDEIDQFEMSPDSGYVQKCGTADAFEQLVSLSASAANSETYKEICSMLDIDAYANYMAAEFYLGGTDWPQNNVKGFRHIDGGKFRFVLFDLDFAFNSNDAFNLFMWKENYTFDELRPSGSGIYIRDDIRFVTLFRNMIQNADFRRRFIDAYSLMGGSVFEATRATRILDELYNNVQPAMKLNGASASSSYNDWKNKLGNRLATATTMIKNFPSFNLTNTQAQHVQLSSNVPHAQLFVNGQHVPTGSFDGNLFQPVTLRAMAPAGYAFQGWISDANTTATSNYYSTQPEIALPPGTSLQFTATFRELTAAEKAAQPLTPISINEVSGANNTYINEYGKKDDWIELYNTTSQPIDLQGMYLSDDETQPEKYQISKAGTTVNTIIPAHGHLIVWCDKRETTAQALHAPFKVSDDGGTILLTAADHSWTDKFTYTAHDATQTVGRYPDGAAEVFLMSVPTIQRANHLSSYTTKIGDIETALHPTTAAAGGSFRIRYGANQLLIKSDQPDDQATVTLYTTDGRLLESHPVTLTHGVARLSVAHLPQGFYLARATRADGVRVACKFALIP